MSRLLVIKDLLGCWGLWGRGHAKIVARKRRSPGAGDPGLINFRHPARQTLQLLRCVSFFNLGGFPEDHDEAGHGSENAADEPSNGGDERRDADEIDFLRDGWVDRWR